MFELLKKYFEKGGLKLTNYHFEYNYIRLYFIKDGKNFDIHILDNEFEFPEYLTKEINNNNFFTKKHGKYILISPLGDDNFFMLLKSITEIIFENHKKKIFLREYSFLEKIIDIDLKLNHRILVYSNKNFIKPIRYLFDFKLFNNIRFYTEKGEKIDLEKFSKIILLMHPNCDDLFLSDEKYLKNIEKIYIGYLDTAFNSYEKLVSLFGYGNFKIISNDQKEDLDIILSRSGKKIEYKKTDFSYLGYFDLFGHSRNFEIGNVDEKYYSDILISIGPNRNIDFFIKNIDFFKKYRCKFINIKHKSFQYSNEIEKLISLNIENFEFLDFLSETDYNLYFKNSKILIIPFNEFENEPWWMTFTQGDAMMYGKIVFVGENYKTKLFHRDYEDGYFNYGILKGDYLYLMKKILEDDDFRKKFEKYSYTSYFKDISIERMLVKFLN